MISPIGNKDLNYIPSYDVSQQINDRRLVEAEILTCINLFQSSVAFDWLQVTGFYLKWNTGFIWINLDIPFNSFTTLYISYFRKHFVPKLRRFLIMHIKIWKIFKKCFSQLHPAVQTYRIQRKIYCITQ